LIAYNIVIIFLSVFYCGLILIYFFGWLKIKRFVALDNSSQKDFFSIIVTARNEEANISACLKSLINQEFPNYLFEIIIIDDHSTDSTFNISRKLIEGFESKINTVLIRLSDLPEITQKKAAITYGVNQAKGRYIILTDADCTREKNWLRTISAFAEKNESKLIYAPVIFKATNIFEKIQELEFAGLLGIGAAAIELKYPNMCSAANLVFEKSAFNHVEGYKGNSNLASGDDEFLMHKIFKVFPDKVHFLKSHEAIVTTNASNSLNELAQQRKRWVSKSTKYQNRFITAILVMAYMFNLSILLNLLLGFINSEFFFIGICQLMAKAIIEGIFLYSVLHFFKRSTLLVFLPLAEVFHIIYVLIIGIWANIGTYNWKGRELK